MNNIFVNIYKKRPLTVEGGEGSFVFDKSGKRYLDFLSGISVNNWGYNNYEIRESIFNQINKIIHPSNYYYTQPQINLAERLISVSGMDKVFFANSGTEANEAVLLFLSKYQNKNSDRNKIIIFSGTFLGRTYGSRMMVSGGKIDNIEFIKIGFNDISAFKNMPLDDVFAVYLELILGHGGIKKIDQFVMEEIYKICKDNNILICVDEVQTGLGRAGDIFLFKEYGIRPDAVTLGKSLGGGIPLSAALVSNRIADCVLPGDYGCTMGGNSLACAAGIKIIDYLLKPEIIKSIKDKGAYLLEKLLCLKKKYNQIIDVRCYGLMCGCEMRDGDAAKVALNAFDLGLLLDVVNKNTLRLLPPFTSTVEEIDIAVLILDKSLNKLTP